MEDIQQKSELIETQSIKVKPVTFSDQTAQTEPIKTKSVEVEVRKIFEKKN